MKNYIQDGKTIEVTAGADISAGDLVLVGLKVGVAINDIANGANGALAMEGVFEVKKEGTDTPAQGGILYLNASNKSATTTASSNKTIGYCWEAAGETATTVKIRLAY
jgi:predicted RecA/RadA family phage recombinase